MKILRNPIRISAVVLCLLLLTGCWDAKELDDLSIPLVLAYDRVLEKEKKYPDDKYLVTVGVPVFYEDVEEKFHAIDTTGQMIGEARERRNTQLGEEVIFGQLQILLLGEELALEENLLSLTDVITRDPRIKASMLIILVKGRAVDIVKTPIHSYPNAGIFLKALMENSRKKSFSPYTTLLHFNRDLVSYETAAILPHIIYSEGEIRLSGSCLVNKGKLIADLGREATESLVLLRGMECSGALSFKAEENGEVIDEATFEGNNSRKVTIERLEDKYVINIEIRLTGAIIEHRQLKPMQNGVDLLKVFKSSLEKHMKKRVEAIVEKTQEEYKCDALNLASYIKAHTREKLTKDDIDKIVQEAEINVDVKVHIKNAGGKM